MWVYVQEIAIDIKYLFICMLLHNFLMFCCLVRRRFTKENLLWMVRLEMKNSFLSHLLMTWILWYDFSELLMGNMWNPHTPQHFLWQTNGRYNNYVLLDYRLPAVPAVTVLLFDRWIYRLCDVLLKFVTSWKKCILSDSVPCYAKLWIRLSWYILNHINQWN